ncbi:MAG: hypothetical protein H7Z20_09395 [Bdellovibrio sp.]|nr:hypothetical protein [Methylotenera sp.]
MRCKGKPKNWILRYTQNDEVWKICSLNKQRPHSSGFDLNSPAAAPSIEDKAGVFGEDCLSAESASSAAARFGEKRRKQAARGSLFFGFFLLAKQKKETRLKAKSHSEN